MTQAAIQAKAHIQVAVVMNMMQGSIMFRVLLRCWETIAHGKLIELHGKMHQALYSHLQNSRELTVKDCHASFRVQVKGRALQVLPNCFEDGVCFTIWQKPKTSSGTQLDLGLGLQSMLCLSSLPVSSQASPSLLCML